MRYLPTLDVWNRAIHAAIFSGQIRLQCGQWIRCGDSPPSRFVKFNGRSIWAAHPEGKRGTGASFRRLCAAAGKGTRAQCNAAAPL